MGSSPPAASGFGSGSFGANGANGANGGGRESVSGAVGGPHVRARSDGGDQMMTPARAQPVPVPHRKERRKPDEVGERMLRGEFYMD